MHIADPRNPNDLEACMWIARKLHTSGITVRHRFDFRERINFYEKQAEAKHGILFYDYAEVREKMNALLNLLDTLKKPEALTHIDLICDNFIISDSEVKLIDWEYAAMCDPLADLAMFSIYSYFSEAQINDLMHRYFRRDPEGEEKLRVYIYVALAGFLWALWTCYKQALGENFGEYGLKMYRYAKDYYKHVMQIHGIQTTEFSDEQNNETANEQTQHEHSEAQ